MLRVFVPMSRLWQTTVPPFVKKKLPWQTLSTSDYWPMITPAR